jgi:hypothetical protein
MGLYGMYVHAFPALMYGGLEAFYPGGTNGALEYMSGNTERNKAIIPNYNPYLPKF